MTEELQRPWPTELRLSKGGDGLTVAFDDGSRYSLSAEFLRVLSPSAEVKGHGPGQRNTVPGKRDVRIIEVVPIGNYAVRLVFDDLHSTGIYSWAYLHSLGVEHDSLWSGYLAELAQNGLDRSPAPVR